MNDSKTTVSPSVSNKARVLKQVRQLHLYLGVFFAPAILFFSFSGALQLFGLHEGRPGEAYQPPKWIEVMGSIHKDQALGGHHEPPPDIKEQHEKKAPEPPAPPQEEEHHEGKATYVLKWFFLAMAVGLVTTTLLGIYMAFKFNRSRVIVWSLLGAGVVIPAGLIALLS